MNNLETLKAQISRLETVINEWKDSINSKQSEIDNFEYECTEDEFSDWIDSIYPEVSIGSLTFSPSEIMKELDPISYRCAKSDYESDYDLDDCEEYTDLKDELESLEDQLSDLESELEELQDELDSLESETNIVITYKENGNESFMYFHADNEEHAIEQFNEFFKDYDGNIELVHCGYIVG